MNLQNDERTSIIQYRIERACSTIIEAEDNSKLGHWNLVANRLYYACFYACSALLISNQINASSHAGINRIMHMNYVKNNIISREDGKLLSDLFSMRQTGDYDDIFDWNRDDIEPLIPKVKDFVKKNNKSYTNPSLKFLELEI